MILLEHYPFVAQEPAFRQIQAVVMMELLIKTQWEYVLHNSDVIACYMHHCLFPWLG